MSPVRRGQVPGVRRREVPELRALDDAGHLLGSAMIVNGELEPLELAHLPYRKGRTYEEYVGAAGLRRMGEKKWRKHVWDVITMLRAALEPDYVIIGGGNVKRLGSLPSGVREGKNVNAFRGGFRLWNTPRRARAHGASIAGTRGGRRT